MNALDAANALVNLIAEHRVGKMPVDVILSGPALVTYKDLQTSFAVRVDEERWKIGEITVDDLMDEIKKIQPTK